MSVALASRPKLRFSGRSLLAFVVEPTPPVADWLNEFDKLARQSFGFFANRPIIVDLSAISPDRDETREIIDALKSRAIRIVAVEGVDPNWLDLSLAPLARGMDSAKVIDFPGVGEQDTGSDAPSPEPPPSPSLIVDKPVRSGQSIVYADGDIIVTGSVSSGAEVVASGSIHIYGTLRGRALAGATGADEALIFCRKFEAELVAVNGCYLTAEMSPARVIGKPVQVRLEGEAISLNVTD